MIAKGIEVEEMNVIILNTEKGFYLEKFYLKTGFNILDKLIIF